MTPRLEANPPVIGLVGPGLVLLTDQISWGDLPLGGQENDWNALSASPLYV